MSWTSVTRLLNRLWAGKPSLAGACWAQTEFPSGCGAASPSQGPWVLKLNGGMPQLKILLGAAKIKGPAPGSGCDLRRGCSPQLRPIAHGNRKLRTVCSTPSNWGKSFTEGDRAAHYSVHQVTSLSWGGQSTHTMKEGFHV